MGWDATADPPHCAPKPRVRPLTDAVAPVLLGGGSGDGVAIVTAEEDDGTLEGGSKVEAGVGVPLAGRPLPKIADHRPVGVGALDGVGGPHGCGEGGGQGGE